MSWRSILLILLLAGCDIGGGSCPDPEPLDLFASGTFTSPGGAPNDQSCPSCGAVFQPHDGVTDLSMDLDLDANVATISYTRDGNAIVERWLITSRREE